MKVLLLNASVRRQGSVTRDLTAEIVNQIKQQYGSDVVILERDLAAGLPLIDEAWVGANFTPVEARSKEQKAALAFSDALIEELRDVDAMVIGLPIYNFGVPAAMKAYIDLVARARVTFKYTENGPVGLLKDRKVFLAVASGGTSVGSPIDFATSWLRQALTFIGINDVTLVDASALKVAGEEKAAQAKAGVADMVKDFVETQQAAAV